MVDGFENLTSGTARIYKCIQSLKKNYMSPMGLKGTHVMCLYFLYTHPEGLSAAQLCDFCGEDKAGISRILAELEDGEYIAFVSDNEKRRYRAKALLTHKGIVSAKKVYQLIKGATSMGGVDVTDEERIIFYRVLFKIGDNLERACRQLKEASKETTNNAEMEESVLQSISDSI